MWFITKIVILIIIKISCYKRLILLFLSAKRKITIMIFYFLFAGGKIEQGPDKKYVEKFKFSASSIKINFLSLFSQNVITRSSQRCFQRFRQREEGRHFIGYHWHNFRVAWSWRGWRRAWRYSRWIRWGMWWV